MRKIMLGVCLVFMSYLGRSQGTGTGLEKIEVEKYYISDAADAAAAAAATPGYKLPVGSVTYRVYVDLAPGAKLVVVTGIPGHELRIATTTEFYNNALGGRTANNLSKANLSKNVALLDSWVSIGAGSEEDFGVLKAEDTGFITNADGVLKNADPAAGVPLTTADGLLAGTPPEVSNVGLNFNIFNAGTTNGNLFSSDNGSWYVLGGATGPTPANRVLIGQFTTNGNFSFELNADIENADGVIESYVARNAEGDQITVPSLIYPAVSNNIAPTVKITAPAEGANYTTGKVVAIEATAKDTDGTVAKVEFLVNGTKVGEDATAPYQYSWTSVKGAAALTAIATDDKGLTATSTVVNINVKDSVINVAPTVQITAPANGANYTTGAVVAIQATAKDTDGTVAKVEFLVNGTKVGEDATAPYQINWTSVKGAAALTAIATDNSGATGTSAAVNITVKDSVINVAPTVQITAPANGATYTTGAVVAIQATAKDTDGTVAKVEFLVNGTKVGEDATAPYTYNWTSVKGAAALTAVAADDKGATGTSTAVNITVKDSVINVAPTVQITAPANGATYTTGAVVAIQATAKDTDGTVAKVEFLVNGTKVGEDATAPYTYNWTSVKGAAALTAVATDDKGATGTSTVVNITVNDSIPGNVAPTVQITAPANGATYTTGAVVAIQASAKDTDGTVAKVEFLVNGTKVGEDATAPYTYNWTSVKGAAALTAVATDDKGATGTSTVVNITVKDSVVANIPPTVQITAPANGATYTTGAVVAIQATAKDTDGTVAKVEFLVNGTKVGEDATAPYTYNWTSVKGAAALTAVATDDKGATGTSTVVNITVNDSVPGNVAPTVQITAPANGSTYTTGAVVAIQATAKDTDGTVAKVEFLVNGTKVGEDATAPYTYNWTSVKGAAALTVVATDDKGATGTSTTVNVTVNDSVPGNVAPTVQITSPANGATYTTGAVVAIQATAKDTDGTVAKVEFLVNGTKVGEDATAPYTYNWTSVKGAAALTAVATDNKGATGTSTVVNITVKDKDSVKNTPPTVQITAPVNGANYTAGDVVAIEATAKDVDGTVTKVEFFVDGTKVGEDATAPYAYNWTSTGTGNKKLTAIATDNKGATGDSRTVTINIKKGNDCANSNLTVDAGANQTVKLGYPPLQSATLTAKAKGGTPAYTYNWSTSQTSATIIVSPTTTTTYTVTVKDKKGCTASDKVTVNVENVKCGNNDVIVCWTYKFRGIIIARQTFCVPQTVALLLTTYFNNATSHWNIGSCTGNYSPLDANDRQNSDDFGGQENLTAEEYALIYGAPSVKLYPNPAVDLSLVNIELNNVAGETAQVTVQDIVGKVIFNEKVAVNNHSVKQQLNFGYDLAKGSYIVRVTTGSTVVTEKLIVQ